MTETPLEKWEKQRRAFMRPEYEQKRIGEKLLEVNPGNNLHTAHQAKIIMVMQGLASIVGDWYTHDYAECVRMEQTTVAGVTNGRMQYTKIQTVERDIQKQAAVRAAAMTGMTDGTPQQ